MEIRFPTTEELRRKLEQSRLARWLGFAGLIQLVWRTLWSIIGWKSQLEEAMTTAQQIGPSVGAVLTLMLSPWFGLALLILGVIYVVLVPAHEHPSSSVGARIAAYTAAVGSLTALFFASVLIVALRLSQVSLPTSSPSGSAYVELATIGIASNLSTFAVGKQLGFNIVFVNPVATRVFNSYAFQAVLLQTADSNADQASWDALYKMSKPFRDQYYAGKAVGRTLGFSESYYDSVGTPLLSQQQYDGIIKGTTRIYLINWYAWADSSNSLAHKESVVDCRWLSGVDGPNYNPSLVVWHFCEADKVKRR